MGDGIGSWAPSLVPSLIIAASTVVAFVLGRALAWLVSRWPRSVRPIRIAVLIASVIVALFFYFSPSSRYALLLPVAFAFGHLTYGHSRIAPRVFD